MSALICHFAALHLLGPKDERIVALWAFAASSLFFCNAVLEAVFKLGVPFLSMSQLEEAPPTLREDTTIAVFGGASQHCLIRRHQAYLQAIPRMTNLPAATHPHECAA